MELLVNKITKLISSLGKLSFLLLNQRILKKSKKQIFRKILLLLMNQHTNQIIQITNQTRLLLRVPRKTKLIRKIILNKLITLEIVFLHRQANLPIRRLKVNNL